MKTHKLSMVLCTSLIHKNFQCNRKLNAIFAYVRACLYGKNINKGLEYDLTDCPPCQLALVILFGSTEVG